MQFWKDDLEVNNTGCFFKGLSLFPSTRTGWLQLHKTRHLVSASQDLQHIQGINLHICMLSTSTYIYSHYHIDNF